MSSRSGRGPRALRGVAAAVIATLVAAASHAGADGHLPSAWNVVLALAFAAPVCVALAGRGMSWWRLSTAVIISQALFHALLSIDFAGRDGSDLIPTAGAHLHAVAVGATTVDPSVVMFHAAVTTPGMWVAHAIATALTVLALGRGEQAVRALLHLVRHPFRALAAFARPPGTDLPALEVEPPGFPSRLAELSVMRRRGPPALRLLLVR